MHSSALLFLVLLPAPSVLFAQKILSSPVRWALSTEKAGANQYDLVFAATIEAGWHVYSLFLADTAGPVPTTIDLGFAPGYEPQGPPRESGDKYQGTDAIFGTEVVRFSRNFTIRQRIEVSSSHLKQISGTIRYMTCDSTRCMAPIEEAFSFVLK